MPLDSSPSANGRGRPSIDDTGTTKGWDVLATELGEVARGLQHTADTTGLLQAIVTAALNLVPGAEEGSVADVVDRGRRIEHKAASSDQVRRLDLLMQEVGQGPCLDAVWEQKTVRVTDLAAEERWPEFAARASGLGARSMLSFQLYIEDDNLGALNLYSSRPGAFTDQSEHVGLLIAVHAAVALAGAQHADNLELALDSRDLIGRAIGILMERHRLNGQRARAVLVRLSQQSNRKLREVAAEVVAEAETQSIG